MDSRGSDVEKGRDLGFDVIQRMHLDSSFPFPEQRPFEDAQTQVDGGGVEGIDVAAKLEDFRCPALTCLCHHAVGELLEDAVVPTAVGLGEVALGRSPSEPKMVGFLTMCLSGQDYIPEAFPIGQLTEHQHRKLVPTSEVLHITVTIVFVRYPEEHVLVDDVQQLCKHVFTFVHIAVVCFDGKDKFKSARSKNPCNFLTYSNFKELF